MSDLQDLYQETIVDHSKRPRNFRRLEEATCNAEGYNPLCGDKVKIYVRVDGDRVSEISFEGSGCAISTASASLLTETLKGKTRAEAESLFQIFHGLVTKGPGAAPSSQLGKLAVFSGISGFPSRVKCATLAWHTLKAALAEQKKPEPVSTE